ncbi:hypothetical protein A3L11_09040 [Thermococcus siculi]|uniref:Bacterial Ig-like domain-containing protein n=1 Tax=Thermococcus siculi TaxID=72803 RepID=A0A2Z2MU97_9EURY|nr:immunoglobulin-like domain-containing protein [Thermococcus siculi]ASJ09366.1 hypothetical protein A3L11_09040 [Thermococcus siculi]
MRKIIPVLLIILLIPVGYYLASYWGSAADGSPNGRDIDHPPTDGPIIGNSTPERPPANDFLKLDKTTYSPTDTMTITVTNNGNLNATTSYHFKLYRLEGGEWKEVPVNLVVIEIAVIIEPGKSWQQRVNLAQLNLEPGHYAIVKTLVFTDPVNQHAMGVEGWAEFDVEG